MCHRLQRTMYEGKNIHYSSSDSKLLCSFSGKLCNQRRLNGYGFCIRHILEDPNAPFKRCAYVAKSSNQMCTQAIPKHEERRYCNNHMQVLGMLPKKERKKKDKQLIETKQPPVIGKTKFCLSKDSVPPIKPATSAEDPDDPYAFPDVGPAENKTVASSVSSTSDSVLGKSLQSGQGFVRSASDISTSGLSMSGGSTIAKYYPELAEKLEKMRAKPEPKVTSKSRARSSRTMNKLQTKIAQNKINEKLRKSQELSQTDSNSSPLQLSSPEHSTSPGPSPASSHTFSPQAAPAPPFTSTFSLSGYEHVRSSQDVPPLPHVDTSFLATLAAQDNLGFPNSGVGDMGLTSERLLTVHTPPRLPPPYPGSSTLSTPSSLASSDLPASAFSPQTNLNCVLESFNSSPQRTAITQVGPSGPSSIPSLNFTHHQNNPSSTSFLSQTSASFTTSSTPSYSFPSSGVTSGAHLKLQNHITAPLPPSNVDLFSLLNINSKLGVDPSMGVTPSAMLPSPNTLAAHLNLPPPPPYVPPAVQQKVSTPVLPSVPVPKVQLSAVPRASVPHVKLHKLNGILSEKEAKRKFRSDLAVKFYSFYAKRRVSSHCMVGPYLCSSDDDSEDEDIDMLPWQREIFSASSDDEADSDDELENDVPMGMRPTKISLLKTRLRRQWCQAKNAYKTNKLLRENSNQATLALIRTVRNGAACAVRALWQITHLKRSKKKIRKRWSKTCCNKSEKEGQCTNQCLPYANHCVKHITYNINQQLFDFCTAKFANNVQCCLPSFDLRHELPLCQEHAAKADNYQKQLEIENKKKPRKKSKPPALTRPPRKGKKKKKGKYTKAQKPLPPPVSIGLESTLSDVDVTSIDTSKPEEGLESPPGRQPTTPHQQSSTLVSQFTPDMKGNSKNLSLELEESLSPDFDKPFELPLEQASRLLEESDFQEVVNKMPFDELDLFGKNGEPDQDADHLCLDLNSANKARDALEKLLTGTMSEEESMQLAMVLAQNLQTDAELAHNAGLITDSSSAAQGTTAMEMTLGSHMAETSDLTSTGAVDHQMMNMQASENSSFVLHSNYQQPLLTTASLTMSSYRNLDSHKMTPTSQQQQTPISSNSVQTMEDMPPVLTADLNAVYGQIESLTRSQLAAKQSSGLNLNHISGLDSFSTSKSGIRHLPTESTPASTSSNLYAGSSQTYLSAIGNSASMAPLQSQVNLEVGRGVVHLESGSTQGFNNTSLPLINAHSRASSGPQHQNFSLYSNSLLPSSQPSSEMSYSLSLPSQAKKAKLDTPSVIPHTSHQKHLQQQLLQQNSTTVRNLLQTSNASKLTLQETNRNLRPHDKAPASPKTSVQTSNKQRLTLPGLQHDGTSFSQKSDGVKLTLPVCNNLLSEASQSRLALPDSAGSYDMLNSVSQSSCTSNAVRYSLTADSSHNSSSTLTSTTTIRHSLLGDSNGPNESISVTVLHPSPMESVPTTVRHTLPDTFPTPMTLPSSPALSLPLKSHSSSAESKLSTAISSQSSSNLHQELLMSQRQQWAPQASMTTNITLQNGLPFGPGSTRNQISNRFSPAGQGSARNKQTKAAAEAARISALASAAGVPVVCNPVSLPGLVQSLPTTTFKSSGSS
ncbi:INO80 complex subunit D-like [Physella acuta]|uniref:INO80 complex subunit D-like n=1 Tax=Physella acuta TaxID=109671 RepID=UPI0027DDDC8C|nr:INO80 complex subunit D-like [Physella acuta]XP_059145383.1 INO80 complex subunit D-like [Physella acuta]